MQGDDRQGKLGYRGGVASQAKSFLAKASGVVAGGVMLASALVLSLAFFAVVLAALLVVGGYVWWRTRDLRRQMREHMQRQVDVRDTRPTSSSGDVIEGVVISREETRDDLRH